MQTFSDIFKFLKKKLIAPKLYFKMENRHNLREAEDMTNKLNDKEFVHYLIDLGLLNSNQICNCGRIMPIEFDYSSNDGVAWKCTSPKCRKYKSVKKNSVFYIKKLIL